MSIKQRVLSWVFPVGSVGRVLRGPLRGFRFRITRNSGWGPIRGGTEFEVALLMRELVRPGWVVYDLGANIGIYSMLYSKLVGERGKVFSFEPLPANLNDLRENLELNSCRNVTIHAVAIGKVRSRCTFEIGQNNSQGKLVDGGSGSAELIDVEVERLDELVAAGLPAPDLIKVDIEGGEADALEGAEQLIAARKPALFVELHTPEQDRRVGAFLSKQGYHVCRIEAAGNSSRFGLHYLSDIPDLAKTWPAPEGIWGRVLALHPDMYVKSKASSSSNDKGHLSFSHTTASA